jgi:MFS family permease
VKDAWLGLTFSEALRTRAFWIVTGGMALFGLIHTAVFFCLTPIFHERGLTNQHAAATFTVFAVCLAAMQLAGGILADRVRAPGLLTTGMAGLALAVYLMHVATTPSMAQVAGAALGAAQGLYFAVAHPLWARYFGRRHLGKIRGVLTTINVAFSSVGPLFAGFTKDWLGNFDVALIAFAVAPLPLAVLSLTAVAPRPASPATGSAGACAPCLQPAEG